MFIADGGGSSPTTPEYSGTQKLQIDPSAIPQARAAFEHALEELTTKLNDAQFGLRTTAWAEDPVSNDTAERFNQRTYDVAVQALMGYQQQLKGVVDQLTAIENQYRITEGDNAALWGKKH